MKIVAFSHYPISTPLHGGQRRLNAIARRAAAAGHQFRHIPIFSRGSYPDATAQELETALPDAVDAALHQPGMRGDLHLADVIGADHPMIAAICDRLRLFGPDIIQFDQPWLYPLFADLLQIDPVLGRARLVYSSQNVEASLIPDPWAQPAEALERKLVQASDLIIAVSDDDAKQFRRWQTRRATPVIVAPNGCWAPDRSGLTPEHRIIAPDYALVIGSAHPPNARGIIDCIGPIPGFLPPDAQLVIAGGVDQLLKAGEEFRRFDAMTANFITMTGPVEEGMLRNLLHFAKVICLPVVDGGGTNLKTAEAMTWLKPVVAMRAAMRGFEAAADLPGVYVADDPVEFRMLMRGAMTGQLGSDRSAEEVAQYEWPAQLAPLIAAYAALAPEQETALEHAS